MMQNLYLSFILMDDFIPSLNLVREYKIGFLEN